MIQHWGVEKRCYYVSQTQKKLMRVPLAESAFWYWPGFGCVFFPDDAEIDGFQGKFHDFWAQIGETLPDDLAMLAFLSQVAFCVFSAFQASEPKPQATGLLEKFAYCRYQLPENAPCLFIGGWHHSTYPFFWFEGTKTKDTKQKKAVSAQVIIKRVWSLRNVPREFKENCWKRNAKRCWKWGEEKKQLINFPCLNWSNMGNPP